MKTIRGVLVVERRRIQGHQKMVTTDHLNEWAITTTDHHRREVVVETTIVLRRGLETAIGITGRPLEMAITVHLAVMIHVKRMAFLAAEPQELTVHPMALLVEPEATTTGLVSVQNHLKTGL